MTEARSPPFRIWWLSIPLLTALAQLANKMIADRVGTVGFGRQWFAELLTTPWTPVMAACQLASLVIWLRILSTVPVSRALPLTAVSYILVVGMGYALFNEPLRPAQLGGSALILLGVGLIMRGDQPV